MEEKKPMYNEPTFVDSIKGRLTEAATDYFRKKFENTKEDMMKYVERTIRKKVKKEVKKYTYTTISVLISIIGILFLIYGVIAAIVYLLKAPAFLSNIIFGSLLLVTGLIIYLMR